MQSRMEKIGIYAGIALLVFMAWQGWRDIHKDNADIRERVKALEVKMDYSVFKIDDTSNIKE